MSNTTHYLSISCAREDGVGGIGCAGGAGFAPEETERQFKSIPAKSREYESGEHTVVLDYLDENRDIRDTKHVDPETAAALLGCSIEAVYNRAWDDLARKQADFWESIKKARAERAREEEATT